MARSSLPKSRSGLRFLPLLPFSVLALALPSQAQTVLPDAGSLRQGIEQLQLRTQPLPPAEQRPAKPAAPSEEPVAATATAQDAAATVTVQSFRFEGNTLLDSAQLSQVLLPYLARPLSFSDLERATAAAAAAFRQAGWLVSAFLPEQGIEGGVVTIGVQEARFGGVQMTQTAGAAPQRVSAEQIMAFASAGQTPGQPLRADQLDRALLLVDELPGVKVAATLVPGPAEGQTSLLLQPSDLPLLYGEVGLDNHGARATGNLRMTANLNLTSPSGHAELANLALLHSQGSDYLRLAVTAPVGHDGWRVGANASVMRYTVVEGPSAKSASPINGRSSSAGLDLTYPLLRSQLANVFFSSALESKDFLNADTQVQSDYASRSLRAGLSGNRYDDLGAGGVSSASAQFHWGRLGSIAAHPMDQRLAGAWRKLSYSAGRQQAVAPGHSLALSWSGQHANQLLDSSEKFYLGGAGSVRAYPSSELSGERGQVLAAEWRWRIKPEWTLSAFWDHGRVTALPVAANEAASRLHLTGRGLSAAWQGASGLNARLVWAHRNGANPKPNGLTPTDADGSLERNRLWLNTSFSF